MSSMLITLFTIAIVSIIWMFWPKKRKGKEVPGPKGLPLIGSLLEVNPENMHIKGHEYASQYGDIVKVTILGQNFIFLNSVDLINKAMCTDPYKRYMNDKTKNVVSPAAGIVNAVDAGPGSVHSQLRKIVVRGFHVYGDGIKAFEGRVTKEILNMMSQIEGHGGKEWNFVDTIERSLSNILSILMIGEPIGNNDKDIIAEYNNAVNFLFTPVVLMVMKLFPFVRYLPGTLKQNFQRFSKSRQRVRERYFKEMKETYQEGKIRGYVDFLIKEQHEAMKTGKEVILTDEMIMVLVGEFCIAGFATTRGTISSIILCLLNNPEYQKKIQAEIDAVVGPDRLPTLEDRQKCPMIEAVITEAIRLDTVAPIGAPPHTTYEHIQFEGYDIPKNSSIWLNFWFLLHNEKLWGDPWVFRPERFLDETGELLPRDHEYRRNWIPFGLGRRQCLGEQFARSRIFLYIATLFQRWDFIPSRDRCGSCDPRSEQFISKLTVHPKPFYCSVQERK